METITLENKVAKPASTNGVLTDYNVDKIRADFPILQRKVYGKPLAFLDNAASTQKPQVVIDTIRQYYEAENANIHRGVYYLSELATQKYEASRELSLIHI